MDSCCPLTAVRRRTPAADGEEDEEEDESDSSADGAMKPSDESSSVSGSDGSGEDDYVSSPRPMARKNKDKNRKRRHGAEDDEATGNGTRRVKSKRDKNLLKERDPTSADVRAFMQHGKDGRKKQLKPEYHKVASHASAPMCPPPHTGKSGGKFKSKKPDMSSAMQEALSVGTMLVALPLETPCLYRCVQGRGRLLLGTS